MTDSQDRALGSMHAGVPIWLADVVATTLALQGIVPTPGMRDRLYVMDRDNRDDLFRISQ